MQAQSDVRSNAPLHGWSATRTLALPRCSPEYCSGWDAITMTGVIVLVIAVSMAASLLPAARAATVEPIQVLREE